jgi:thymidine kinase
VIVFYDFKMSKLRFLYGTMASAKTLRLLTTAYNFEEKGLQFMVLKPSQDTRDGEDIIASRVGLQRECVSVHKELNLYKAIEEYNIVLKANLDKLEWILIDEAQFLTEEQVDQLAQIVDDMNIEVMCFGLRTDFQSHLFPGSKRLMELADEIEEVKSRCACGRKTSINARLDEQGQVIFQGEQVVVGGDDKYKPLCRKCWNILRKNKISNKEIKKEEK